MDSIPRLHRQQKKRSEKSLVEGTVLSLTTIHHPPAGFGHEPYAVGLIALDDGSKVCAQITGDGPLPRIGMRVAPCMRRVRTLSNGLFVNDIKYEMVTGVPQPQIKIRSYVLALTGPSGVGKTTVTRMLMSLFSSYSEQVPIYTTRPPKKNEVEPYKYVSEKEFDRMLKEGEMVAHTQMASKTELRRYGYRKADIEALWEAGKVPIVVTDIHLLKGLEKSLGRRSILSCGLLPPGNSRRRMLSSLLHRMRARGRETEVQIEERLKVAESDLAAFDQHPHLFDHLLVNDKLELCVEQIMNLVPVENTKILKS